MTANWEQDPCHMYILICIIYVLRFCGMKNKMFFTVSTPTNVFMGCIFGFYEYKVMTQADF